MFDNDDTLKAIGHDHRLKIIECMQFREFQKGEPIFFKFKEKNSKLVFCLKGKLVTS